MSDGVARVTILLVDDHQMFREGVGRMLAREPDFTILGDCASGEDALEVLRRSHVDLVLLDFDLGQREGVAVVERIRAAHPTLRILLVTAGVDAHEATALIRAGVSGVFSKKDSAQSLIQSIRAVLAGNVAFEEQLFRRAVADTHRPEGPAQPSRLTRREREVLAAVFQGLANKEIADRLGISESAVKGTLQQLFSKTGVRTRSQLVRLALERYRFDLNGPADA